MFVEWLSTITHTWAYPLIFLFYAILWAVIGIVGAYLLIKAGLISPPSAPRGFPASHSAPARGATRRRAVSVGPILTGVAHLRGSQLLAALAGSIILWRTPWNAGMSVDLIREKHPGGVFGNDDLDIYGIDFVRRRTKLSVPTEPKELKELEELKEPKELKPIPVAQGIASAPAADGYKVKED